MAKVNTEDKPYQSLSPRMVAAVKMLLEIVDTHEANGFQYPRLHGFRVEPKLIHTAPPIFDLNPAKVRYEQLTRTIHLNWSALGDTRDSIVEFIENCEDDPLFRQKYGGLLRFADPNLFSNTSQQELRALISRALGEYLFEMLLLQHPDSWLHDETDLVAAIFRGGILRWFEELYTPSTESIPTDIWERHTGSTELDNPNGLRYWLIHTAGVHLVRPLMQLGDRAFHYLATHPVDTSNYELDRLPAYVEEAVRQLQTS